MKAVAIVSGWISCTDETGERRAIPKGTRTKFRVSKEEREALAEGAARYGVTPTTFVRRAISAAVTQQPVLSRDERIAIGTCRDQFRRAAQNLDSLLRQVYLFQSGVMDRGLSEDDFASCSASFATVPRH
jgi:hypothetical protein